MKHKLIHLSPENAELPETAPQSLLPQSTEPSSRSHNEQLSLKSFIHQLFNIGSNTGTVCAPHCREFPLTTDIFLKGSKQFLNFQQYLLHELPSMHFLHPTLPSNCIKLSFHNHEPSSRSLHIPP